MVWASEAGGGGLVVSEFLTKNPIFFGRGVVRGGGGRAYFSIS